ncbi:MAG TPA: Zn-ribbon domain-containing OB-fold protein [Candidatus Binatia bacterium]|nr:Zn-ribbon domain-containing OB-fold protein [Candidatus Binatia bacterium]
MTESTVTVRAFFERARAGQLTGIRCGSCGELAMPPKELCPNCHARAWETVTLAGEGTIASFTVIRVAPRAHAADVPYAVAVVRLKEGVSILGRVVDIPLDKLAVGLPVRFRPLVTHDQTSVGFGPP